jgi:hypothetical protein
LASGVWCLRDRINKIIRNQHVIAYIILVYAPLLKVFCCVVRDTA